MIKKTASILAISIALLASFPAIAQVAPPAGFAQERYKDFKADKDVTYGTLSNGMRYAIQQWPTPKGEVSIRMRIAGGSLHEKENQKGLMHFLEHMAFNGSTNIKEGEMIPLLEKEGLAFGADTNAHTSFDETTYQLDMPKPEQLDLGLKLMRETAGRLTLAPSAINRERGIIKGEERARMSPGYKQWIDFANTNYSGFLFPKRVPIGDMKIVGSAPPKEFKELYYGLYRPERTFLVVVGDVDAKNVKSTLEKYFVDWKGVGRPIKDPDIGKILKEPAKFKNYVDPQLPSEITISATRPLEKSPDSSQARRNDLLKSIANSIVNQRFAKLSRAEDAPFSSANIGNYDMLNQVNVSYVEISPKTQKDWPKSLEIAQNTLKTALTFGFSDDEFKAQLLSTQEAYERAALQDKARRSREIAEGIIAAFEGDDVYTSSADDLAWFKANMNSLNAKDALAQLQKVWKDTTRNVYMVSQSPIDGGSNALRQKYAQVESAPVQKPILEATKQWDYTDFGPKASSPTRIDNKELGISFLTFSNNVHVVVKPSDFEKGRVRVSMRFGGGQFAIPADKIGANLSTSASFDNGGLGRFSADDLAKTLAGHSVDTGFSTGLDAFNFGATTNDKDLLLQLQIFSAYMTDPGWRKDGFNQLKAAKDAIYKQARATPEAVMSRELGPILESNHYTSIFPSEAQFDALNFDDAKMIVDAARANSAIELVVVGDTSVENVINAVAPTLGALPMRQEKPQEYASSKINFPSGRKETNLTHDGRADQSVLIIAYPTTDFGDGAIGRKLNILRDMLNVKLTDIIREKEGGSYSPQVVSNASQTVKDFGWMGIILNIKPEEIPKYQAITENIVKDFADGKIDEDLLKRAKEPSIASIKTTMANNPWWVSWLSSSTFDSSRIVAIRDGKKQYEEITLADMKALAKQYFDPKKAQIVKITPTSKTSMNK